MKGRLNIFEIQTFQTVSVVAQSSCFFPPGGAAVLPAAGLVPSYQLVLNNMINTANIFLDY